MSGAKILRERLGELAEPGYRDFQKKSIYTQLEILGVRMGALRVLARDLGRADRGR